MFDKIRRRRRALSRIEDFLKDQEELFRMYKNSGGSSLGSINAHVIGDLEYALEIKNLPTPMYMRLHAYKPDLKRKLQRGGRLMIMVRPVTDPRGQATSKRGEILREAYRIWWVHTSDGLDPITPNAKNLLGLKEYDLEGDDKEAYREAGFFS